MRRTLAPCLSNGCPALAREGYCPKHEAERLAKQTERDRPAKREADLAYKVRRTDQKIQAFYKSARWQRFRNWYAAGHPLCEECLRQGRAVPMRLVDHIVPVKSGGALMSVDNVQSLCALCHHRKHRIAVAKG